MMRAWYSYVIVLHADGGGCGMITGGGVSISGGGGGPGTYGNSAEEHIDV